MPFFTPLDASYYASSYARNARRFYSFLARIFLCKTLIFSRVKECIFHASHATRACCVITLFVILKDILCLVLHARVIAIYVQITYNVKHSLSTSKALHEIILDTSRARFCLVDPRLILQIYPSRAFFLTVLRVSYFSYIHIKKGFKNTLISVLFLCLVLRLLTTKKDLPGEVKEILFRSKT